MKPFKNKVMHLLHTLLLILLVVPIGAQVQIGAPIPTGDYLRAIAITDDGSRVAVGEQLEVTPGNFINYVFIYEWDGTSWSQLGNTLFDANGQSTFGERLAFGTNNSLLVAQRFYSSTGNNRIGNVREYVWTGSAWNYVPDDEFFNIPGSQDGAAFGLDIAISSGGEYMIGGAPFYRNSGLAGRWHGSIELARYSSTLGWQKLGSQDFSVLTGNSDEDRFGISVDISDDGHRFAVGSLGGYVRTYTFTPVSAGATVGNFVQDGGDITFPGESTFGKEVSMSGTGDRLIVATNNKLFTYALTGGNWTLDGPALTIDPTSSLIFKPEISSDGNILTFYEAGSNSGSTIYSLKIYHWICDSWVQAGSTITQPPLIRNNFLKGTSQNGQYVGFVIEDLNIYETPPLTNCSDCTDNIQNGNETGIDCGGPDCPACPTTCPDLTPTTFTYNEANNTWTVTITNLGTETIDFSGNSVIAQAYWNDTPTVPGSQPAGGFTLPGTLAPGETYSTTLSAGSNSGSEPILVIMVDLNNTLTECDETNNLAFIDFSEIDACTDGVQNFNETGIDCGGPTCPACPTCTDGIQNGNETGVDCGGSDCDPCAPAGDITELFFSEYVEGSSNNKAIEIYNGTTGPVDLSNYRIELYANGRALASGPTQGLNLSGTVASNDVYVIVNNQSEQSLLDMADLISGSVTGFNGDDALILLKNGLIVDMFGTVGQDPGSAWTGGGVSTANMTLVRKSAISAGKLGGFSDPSIDWIGLPSNTYDSLGFHRANAAPVILPITLTAFNARTVGKNIQLAWTTSREENTRSFTLERSADNGRTFQPIGEMMARNSPNGATYELLDETAASAGNNTLYYRLKAVDFDESTELYGPVRAQLNSVNTGTLTIFPNPVSAAQSVRVQGISGTSTLELLSIDGRLIGKLTASERGVYALPNVSAGVYLIRAIDDELGGIKMGRFVVQ